MLLLGTVLAVACTKQEATPAADSAAMDAPANARRDIALADVAGTWTVNLSPRNRDTTLLTYTMTATADTTGWGILFPGRTEPVPMRIVHVGGDSIVAEAGPYESALRPGVPVTVHVVSRLQGERLRSRITARYQTTGADSVVQLRAVGQRAQ